MSSKPGWSVDFERRGSAHDPGSEHEVGKTEGVIRVQVSDENLAQIWRFQAFDAGLRGGRGASHDARAHVDQVRGAIHDDCDSGAGMLGIRTRAARAQENDLRFRPSGCCQQTQPNQAHSA